MLRLLALANQKGGVGKTTTAVNLAAGLALAGRDVLLIDLDPQANATSGLGVGTHGDRFNHPLLTQTDTPHPAPLSSGRTGLNIIPSAPDLLKAEKDLHHPDSYHRLDNFLSEHRSGEFVIMDCPPSLGPLTRNALVAAQGVIVPIQCEYYAMEGLTRILTELDEVKREHNVELQLAGILLTMYDPELELSREVVEEVEANFPEKVFTAVIPRDVTLSEASSFGQTIFEYARRSPAAFAYTALTREVLWNEQA